MTVTCKKCNQEVELTRVTVGPMLNAPVEYTGEIVVNIRGLLSVLRIVRKGKNYMCRNCKATLSVSPCCKEVNEYNGLEIQKCTKCGKTYFNYR